MDKPKFSCLLWAPITLISEWSSSGLHTTFHGVSPPLCKVCWHSHVGSYPAFRSQNLMNSWSWHYSLSYDLYLGSIRSILDHTQIVPFTQNWPTQLSSLFWILYHSSGYWWLKKQNIWFFFFFLCNLFQLYPFFPHRGLIFFQHIHTYIKIDAN